MSKDVLMFGGWESLYLTTQDICKNILLDNVVPVGETYGVRTEVMHEYLKRLNKNVTLYNSWTRYA